MADTTIYHTQSTEETQALGERMGRSLIKQDQSDKRGPVCFCFRGELGSGKTTLIQGIARGLGISRRLLSPTYLLVRSYSVSGRFSQLYHIDLYRVSGSIQLEELGILEILEEPRAIVLIEWADRLGTFLPSVRTDIKCRILEDGSHKFSIKPYAEA